MSITRLWSLIIKQNRFILMLILLIGIGISIFDGIAGSQAWHGENNGEQLFFTQEKRVLKEHKKRVSKESAVRKYKTWTEYANANFQVYRYQPSTILNSHSDRWTPGLTEVLLVMAPIAGVSLVSFSRKKYFQELLQEFGYSRRQIFNSSLSVYGMTVWLAMTIGEISKSLILYGTIPPQYFKFFTWGNWISHLVAISLLSLVMLLLGTVINLVLSNYVVSALIAGFLYLDWAKIVAIIMLRPVDDDVYSDYFTLHWGIGILVTIVLIVGLAVIGNYLNQQYSSEMQSEPVTILWLKPVVFGLFAIFGSLSFGHFLERLLLGLPIFVSYLIAIVLVVFVMIVWLYRPKWSRRLWELTAELR